MKGVITRLRTSWHISSMNSQSFAASSPKVHGAWRNLAAYLDRVRVRVRVGVKIRARVG